jgi:RNA polymerase sigma factor (sigma-70 family)
MPPSSISLTGRGSSPPTGTNARGGASVAPEFQEAAALVFRCALRRVETDATLGTSNALFRVTMDISRSEQVAAEAETVVSASGQVPTFETFFELEYPTLVKALYVTTRNLSEAEDLAQESMARVFARWDRVGSMTSPRGYLYRTAMNLNLARLRHLRVRARSLFRPPPPRDEAATIAARSDLVRAIAALPQGQREALVLTEWAEMTSDEAAEALGIKPSSVRSRTHRAHDVLKERLEVRDE